MPELTVFTAPKPFTDPHIDLIQRNAIRAALALTPKVEFLLIGDEPGLAEAAAELGARHLPDVQRNDQGTPLIHSIFEVARSHSQSPYLAYINGDILLFSDLLPALRLVAQDRPRFLVVSQRRDLWIHDPLDFSTPESAAAIREDVLARGHLSDVLAIDMFLFPRDLYRDIPAFALGRAGWDNWMIYHARAQGWPCIDLTEVVTLGHQKHDYTHLPGGQTHHRLPESFENVRLAGGMRSMLSIADTPYELKSIPGQVARKPLTWARFWREVELFPWLRLRSRPLANLFFAIFHPRRAIFEARPALSQLKRKLLRR